MTLIQKKTADGYLLEKGAEWPDQHRFSSEMFAELALAGVATMTPGQEGAPDVVTLTYGPDVAQYEVLSRPGEDEEFMTSWNLALVEVSKGKREVSRVSEKIGTGVKFGLGEKRRKAMEKGGGDN